MDSHKPVLMLAVLACADGKGRIAALYLQSRAGHMYKAVLHGIRRKRTEIIA